MEVIIISSMITLILLVWFKTNAFVEYARLFHISRFLKVEDYINSGSEDSFPDFLVEFYNCFFTRLISCPICLSVWLGIIGSVITTTSFPITIVLGLFFYLLSIKLL